MLRLRGDIIGRVRDSCGSCQALAERRRKTMVVRRAEICGSETESDFRVVVAIRCGALGGKRSPVEQPPAIRESCTQRQRQRLSGKIRKNSCPAILAVCSLNSSARFLEESGSVVLKESYADNAVSWHAGSGKSRKTPWSNAGGSSCRRYELPDSASGSQHNE